MKKNDLRKEIAALINSIKDHSDNIGDKPHIQQLELEVILQKIKKLYELSIVFNHINTVGEEKTPETVAPVESPVTEAIQATSTSETENGKSKQGVIDLFSEQSTDNNNTKEKQDTNVSEKFQRSRIENLKLAIGINEKFQFVNELFDGNTNEYHAAIDQLNAFSDSDEANIYLNNLQGIYQWNMEHPVMRNFMDLVKRRFQ